MHHEQIQMDQNEMADLPLATIIDFNLHNIWKTARYLDHYCTTKYVVSGRHMEGYISGNPCQII